MTTGDFLRAYRDLGAVFLLALSMWAVLIVACWLFVQALELVLL